MKHSQRNPFFRIQDYALLDQDNPVSGTKYTILDEVINARILEVTVSTNWTVQPTPLELHGTIDGRACLWGFVDPVIATGYFPYGFDVRGDWLNMALVATQPSGNKDFLGEFSRVKLEAEITGGTVQKLYGRCKYSLRV